jgi:pilus assembly protein CpaE
MMGSTDHPKGFQLQGTEAGVQLCLSDVEGEASALVGRRVAGLPIQLSIVPVTDWIDPTDLATAAVAVVQVDADTPASIKRFERLAKNIDKPLIAACYEPPLALVRHLLKAGAHDVLPLPLTLDDLETSVAPIRDRPDATPDAAPALTGGRLITVIKARGGIGATSLVTQLACRFAASEAVAGREVALFDFDVQFGDAAFLLGLKPRMTVADLVEAGPRLDGPLLRSVLVPHASGLQVAGAPRDMLPLETLGSDQVLTIVERALRDVGTVFVDLPANWTNWSLSLVARSHLVLLVGDLSVPGLQRARRQLDMLAEQGLGEVELRLVVNRFEKGLFKSVKTGDAERVLGRSIDFTVASDPELMEAALAEGREVREIKRKAALVKDLEQLDLGVAAALNLER